MGCGKKEKVEHHANANTSPTSSENESLPKIKNSEGEQKIKFTNRLPESGAWALYNGKLFLSSKRIAHIARNIIGINGLTIFQVYL